LYIRGFPMPPSVRAICFDLDDTFWEVRPVLQRAETRMAAFLREKHPVLGARFASEDLYARRMALVQERPDRAHDMTWLRTEALRRFALEHEHDPTIADEAFAVFIDARHDVTFFDDVLPALERLSGRYPLATFSNGNADVHRIGIGGHFVVTLNAEKVGHAKPKPEAFLAVADSLGLRPEQILYVGDEPRLDVMGSRAAGCRSVWINRRETPWPADLSPAADLEVSNLLELVDWLDESTTTGSR
jgi:putative hydrolase of the HAD superfamily